MQTERPRSTLILAAIDLEAATLARHLSLRHLHSGAGRVFGDGHLRIGSVGIGAARLTERWARLLDGLDRPLVVSSGVCGGLEPALAIGDVVVPDRLITSSGERIELGGDAAFGPAGLRARIGGHGGALVTASRLVDTPAAKARLHAETRAVAVDMESVAIVAAAHRASLPALVVRGVSDPAGESVPVDLLRTVTADGRVRPGAAILLVLTSPRTLPRALALGRATRRALLAVARALAALSG